MPNILTFYVTNFRRNKSKLQFKEKYSEKLSGGKVEKFKLFGVVEHLGADAREGHYIAYVRGPSNIWYKV